MPLVDSNFFGHPDDLRLTVASLRFRARGARVAPAVGPDPGRTPPGRDVTDDAGLEAFCGKTVKTNYHPVGSAPMGPDGDPMAVLDASFACAASRLAGDRLLGDADDPVGQHERAVMALASRAVDLIAGVSKAKGAAA